jgi:hypothetical protein
VKSASEEDTLLKLCVCTILMKNMQVGCHNSFALKDQFTLKIVYDKNLSFSFFSAVFLTNYLSSLLYKCLVILRNTTTEIWQPVSQFFVQNSGNKKLHKALSSLSLLTTCIKSAVYNLHQVCIYNLHQICSSLLAASLLTTTCKTVC